jgi:hypothetical protein
MRLQLRRIFVLQPSKSLTASPRDTIPQASWYEMKKLTWTVERKSRERSESTPLNEGGLRLGKTPSRGPQAQEGSEFDIAVKPKTWLHYQQYFPKDLDSTGEGYDFRRLVLWISARSEKKPLNPSPPDPYPRKSRCKTLR